MEKNPLVSVIIPKTEKEDISLSLSAIKGGSYKNVEIIVVQEGLERSEQRNIGIAQANGKYLFILDADQVPGLSLIEECVGLMACGYGALYIPEIIPGESLFDRIRNFERSFYTATYVDVVRFVRRKYCPYFDPTMAGPEDSAWDRTVHGLRGTTKNPLYHFDHVTLKKYIAKKSYYAKSMKRYKELYPKDKVLNLWYRCFTVFTENGKWKRLLRHPILSLGIIFILTIRGVIWIKK